VDSGGSGCLSLLRCQRAANNMGYREDDEEPDFYWDDDLKKGSGADDNTDKVNDREERLDK
jgi:hypothetical protein